MSEIDELVRGQRFEEIAESRRQVREYQKSIREARAVGRISESESRRLLQNAVDDYVREFRNLLDPPSTDDTSEFWDSKLIGRIEVPEGGPIEVEGLQQYLALPEQIPVEVTETVQETYHSVSEQRTRTVLVQPNRKLILGAFEMADRARADLGLELDLGDSESAGWDTDYRNGDHETTA